MTGLIGRQPRSGLDLRLNTDSFRPSTHALPDGVMVAQATLTRLVMVRIHVGQPKKGVISKDDEY